MTHRMILILAVVVLLVAGCGDEGTPYDHHGDSVTTPDETGAPSVYFVPGDDVQGGQWRIEFSATLRAPAPVVFETRTARFYESKIEDNTLIVEMPYDEPAAIDELFVLLNTVHAQGDEFASGFNWAANWPRALPIKLTGTPPSLVVTSHDTESYWVVHRQTPLVCADDNMALYQLSPGEVLISDGYPEAGQIRVSRPLFVEPPPVMQIDPMSGRNLPLWQNERQDGGMVRVDVMYKLVPPLSRDVAVVATTNPYTVTYLSLVRQETFSYSITRALSEDVCLLMEAALQVKSLSSDLLSIQPFDGPRVGGEALDLALSSYRQYADRISAELESLPGLPSKVRSDARVWASAVTDYNLAVIEYSMTGDIDDLVSRARQSASRVVGDQGLIDSAMTELRSNPLAYAEVREDLFLRRQETLWRDVIRETGGAVSLRSTRALD